MPYGLKSNEKNIMDLIAHAKTQKILSGNERLEDLFAKETLDLAG